MFFDADINEAIGVAKEMGRVLSRRLRDNHMAMNRLDLFSEDLRINHKAMEEA